MIMMSITREWWDCWKSFIRDGQRPATEVTAISIISMNLHQHHHLHLLHHLHHLRLHHLHHLHHHHPHHIIQSVTLYWSESYEYINNLVWSRWKLSRNHPSILWPSSLANQTNSKNKSSLKSLEILRSPELELSIQQLKIYLFLSYKHLIWSFKHITTIIVCTMHVNKTTKRQNRGWHVFDVKHKICTENYQNNCNKRRKTVCILNSELYIATNT